MKSLLSSATFSDRLHALKAFGADYYSVAERLTIGRMIVEIELNSLKRLNEI